MGKTKIIEHTKSKVLNFGSLNIDHVYSVEHIVVPGETITSDCLETFPGGKGLNQSVALSRAGAHVYHAGIIGNDGTALTEMLQSNGVETEFILQQEKTLTGHAIIQVDKNGQNSIVLFKGANYCFTKEYIDSVFAKCMGADLVLLQNEINLIPYVIKRAKAHKCKVALNPSPFTGALLECDFNSVDILLLNEIEGEQISDKNEPDEILDFFKNKYPQMIVALTLGSNGSALLIDGNVYRHGIYKTKVVDTTAAGDTFTGFFLCGLLSNMPPDEILRYAATASGLAVSQKGASTSIPTAPQVREKQGDGGCAS